MSVVIVAATTARDTPIAFTTRAEDLSPLDVEVTFSPFETAAALLDDVV